jgi:RNA polymerase sigma-70 factor (ECF subfamily)
MVVAGVSDYEVVRESLGSPPAFGAIFDRHGAGVYRYVRRRVGDDLASDLTAEVFLRGFRDRGRFDGRGEGSALPWLLGIATNVVAMNQRSEKRRLRAYARAAASEPAAPSMGDGELLEVGAARVKQERQLLVIERDLRHSRVDWTEPERQSRAGGTQRAAAVEKHVRSRFGAQVPHHRICLDLSHPTTPFGLSA